MDPKQLVVMLIAQRSHSESVKSAEKDARYWNKTVVLPSRRHIFRIFGQIPNTRPIRLSELQTGSGRAMTASKSCVLLGSVVKSGGERRNRSWNKKTGRKGNVPQRETELEQVHSATTLQKGREETK
jgi:hypothetical protein